MNADIVKYIFWILISLPLLGLGLYFFSTLTSNIYNRYKEEEKIRKEKEKQIKRRQEFEERYSRRRGGGA